MSISVRIVLEHSTKYSRTFVWVAAPVPMRKRRLKDSSMHRAVVAFISTNGRSPPNCVWFRCELCRKSCRRLDFVDIPKFRPHFQGYLVHALTLIWSSTVFSCDGCLACLWRSPGGAVGIQDMALTCQALHDWLGVTRFGGSRCVCVCVQVREDF